MGHPANTLFEKFDRSRSCCTFALMLSSLPLSAAGPTELFAYSLKELSEVKIATGTSIALKTTPATTSLITSEDIQSMGALSIDEVLASIPGLNVIPSSLNILLASYAFRGIYTGQNSQVIMMVNGNRISSDFWSTGVIPLSRMNVKSIARIEVIRGPGSAIYGADAFTGVINVITKKADDINGLNIGFRAGPQSTKNLWMQYGTKFDNDWSLAINFEYFKQNTDKNRIIESDFQTFFDTLFGSSASLAPTYLDDRTEATNYSINLRNENWDIGIDGYVNQDYGLGAGAAQIVDHQGSLDYNHYLLYAVYRNTPAKNIQLETKVSYLYTDYESSYQIFPANSVLPVGNDGNIFTPHDGIGCNSTNIPEIGCLTTFSDGFIGNPQGEIKAPTFEITANVDAYKNHKLRFSVGITKQTIHFSETKNFGPGVLDRTSLVGNPNPQVVDGTLTNTTGTEFIFSPNVTRNVKYFSVQDIWNINKDWTLTAGVRYDHYSDFGSTTNPRIALVWNTSEKLTTKLLYGEAFRAPSSSELYAENNPITLGNKNVGPEKIDTTELSFSYRFSGNFSSQINFYHLEAQDMIEFTLDSEGIGSAQNIKKIKGDGLELESYWKPSENLTINGNYSYQSTKDGLDNSQLEIVPMQQIYFNVHWKFAPSWTLSSQINWVLDRRRASSDPREPLGDYQLTNLTLRKKLNFRESKLKFDVAIMVKNLFDEDIFIATDGKVPGDLPMHKRQIYFEISSSF